jgi:hypothetical protein
MSSIRGKKPAQVVLAASGQQKGRGESGKLLFRQLAKRRFQQGAVLIGRHTAGTRFDPLWLGCDENAA